jgi:hypothetical protein
MCGHTVSRSETDDSCLPHIVGRGGGGRNEVVELSSKLPLEATSCGGSSAGRFAARSGGVNSPVSIPFKSLLSAFQLHVDVSFRPSGIAATRLACPCRPVGSKASVFSGQEEACEGNVATSDHIDRAHAEHDSRIRHRKLPAFSLSRS